MSHLSAAALLGLTAHPTTGPHHGATGHDVCRAGSPTCIAARCRRSTGRTVGPSPHVGEPHARRLRRPGRTPSAHRPRRRGVLPEAGQPGLGPSPPPTGSGRGGEARAVAGRSRRCGALWSPGSPARSGRCASSPSWASRAGDPVRGARRRRQVRRPARPRRTGSPARLRVRRESGTTVRGSGSGTRLATPSSTRPRVDGGVPRQAGRVARRAPAAPAGSGVLCFQPRSEHGSRAHCDGSAAPEEVVDTPLGLGTTSRWKRSSSSSGDSHSRSPRPSSTGGTTATCMVSTRSASRNSRTVVDAAAETHVLAVGRLLRLLGAPRPAWRR